MYAQAGAFVPAFARHPVQTACGPHTAQAVPLDTIRSNSASLLDLPGDLD